MQLKIQELTNDAFALYGTYLDLYQGHDDAAISFLPDRMLHFIGSPSLDSLSSICIRYRQPIINVTEYHENCEEIFGGFNCDIIFHVGLLGKNGEPDLSTFAVFRLPKGMYARVKRLVLHHAGFVMGKGDQAHGVVMLSPAAYTIDCKTINIESPLSIAFN